MSTAELSRRRAILNRYIGSEVRLRREAVKRNKMFLRSATLLDVRRTRAVLDYGDSGEWTVPIDEIWLPPSPQPAPNQRELFDG